MERSEAADRQDQVAAVRRPAIQRAAVRRSRSAREGGGGGSAQREQGGEREGESDRAGRAKRRLGRRPLTRGLLGAPPQSVVTPSVRAGGGVEPNSLLAGEASPLEDPPPVYYRWDIP